MSQWSSTNELELLKNRIARLETDALLCRSALQPSDIESMLKRKGLHRIGVELFDLTLKVNSCWTWEISKTRSSDRCRTFLGPWGLPGKNPQKQLSWQKVKSRVQAIGSGTAGILPYRLIGHSQLRKESLRKRASSRISRKEREGKWTSSKEAGETS